MGYSMRTDRHLFTVWVTRDDHTKVNAIELYDQQTDPQENTNIANLPDNASSRARKGWVSHIGDREMGIDGCGMEWYKDCVIIVVSLDPDFIVMVHDHG